MIGILILGIVTIMVISIASLSAFQSSQTASLAFKGQALVSELYQVKNQLLAYAIIYNDVPALPYGTNGSGHQTLPSYILKKRNAFGRHYVYCPFSPLENDDQSETVSLSENTHYSVSTNELSIKGITQKYVTYSDQNQFVNLGVQAIIISPTPPFTGSIRCQDVAYNADDEIFTVSGGRVEVITTPEIEAAQL